MHALDPDPVAAQNYAASRKMIRTLIRRPYEMKEVEYLLSMLDMGIHLLLPV